jgi:predicted transcriptional regulator
VDEQVEAEVLARLEALAETLARPPQAAAPAAVFDYEGERAKVLRRRTNLVNAIAEGVITTEHAREKMAAIDRALDALDERRDRAKVKVQTTAERAARLRDVKAIRKAWPHTTTDDKRRIVATLAERVALFSTQTKRWQRNAWKLVITWKETQ